ncbi:hypothetical protein Tco_0627904 [Tanacetum coccineum]|uniref:Uncharacterized protein n=1 Tax=Tanacetum coccineum TaxID=301880 RepID=A0ABQ4WNQ5_9ASTR
MCVVNILNFVNSIPIVKIVLNKGKQIWKPKGKLSDNSLNKTKQIWKPKGKLSDNSLNKTKRVWKATGILFANVGYQWRPTGKKFALGELCPLTKLSGKCGTDHPLVSGLRNDHVGAIIGYEDYMIGDSVISRVYYMEGLGHNLFSWIYKVKLDEYGDVLKNKARLVAKGYRQEEVNQKALRTLITLLTSIVKEGSLWVKAGSKGVGTIKHGSLVSEDNAMSLTAYADADHRMSGFEKEVTSRNAQCNRVLERQKKLRNQIFRALTASTDVPSSVTETTDTTSTLPPPPPPLQKPTGTFKDGDGNTLYQQSVKASANSVIIFFFTSAQDGNRLLDDERLCLDDDLKKAHDQNQNKSK